MKQKQIIRSALTEGPCTAAELGVIVGLPMRTCSAWLSLMRGKGEVTVIGEKPVKNRGGRQFQNIYALAEDTETHAARPLLAEVAS